LIDPPIWYLCVEFKMLFIMPIVVWLIKRHGWSMATFIFGISLFVPSLPFALGLLFVYLTGYMVRKALVEFPSLAQWIQNCSTLTVVCLVIASLLCLGFYDITQLPEHLSYHGLHGFQALGVMLLLPIVYLRGGRWMYHPILQWLGKVSYQVYLIHFIVMLALRPIALPVPIYIVSVLVITFILAQGMKTVDIWIQSKIEKIL
jgi:peptidoglycan/LPS O-acetylase OafA/YrhL